MILSCSALETILLRSTRYKKQLYFEARVALLAPYVAKIESLCDQFWSILWSGLLLFGQLIWVIVIDEFCEAMRRQPVDFLQRTLDDFRQVLSKHPRYLVSLGLIIKDPKAVIDFFF